MIKRNSTKILMLFAILMLSLFCVGCNDTVAPSNVADEEEDDGIQIGLSFDSFVIERWERDRDVFVSAAKEQGADVLVQVADGDLEEQKEQIRYFIKKGVDAIVVIAVDCNGLSDVVEEAHDAGIYVISYDRMILNADIDLLVTFDNVRVGELMAEGLVNNVKPSSKIVCINGSENDNNVSEVQSGFNAVLDKTSVSVIYNDYCPNWEAEKGYEILEELLNKGMKFDGVMCGNDDIATVVYRALSERGLIDKIRIVGQDADLAACQRIINGWQAMTVYKSVESLAREAANDTIELIVDGNINTSEKLDNGMKAVPAVLLEPIAVNKENMDEVIIDGGFHTHAEVYGD